MADLPLGDVTALIAAANAGRGWRDGSGGAPSPDGTGAEGQLEALFGVSRRLAAYGTLAPGRPNHHVVAPLGGEWTAGIVEGDMSAEGWGTTFGYPAFRPRIGGPAVAVQVLTAAALAGAWDELDEFEGPEYQRILVPVFRPDSADERRLYTVANIFAAAAGRPERG